MGVATFTLPQYDTLQVLEEISQLWDGLVNQEVPTSEEKEHSAFYHGGPLVSVCDFWQVSSLNCRFLIYKMDSKGDVV